MFAKLGKLYSGSQAGVLLVFADFTMFLHSFSFTDESENKTNIKGTSLIVVLPFVLNP
jgi:hypothetical protein